MCKLHDVYPGMVSSRVFANGTTRRARLWSNVYLYRFHQFSFTSSTGQLLWLGARRKQAVWNWTNQQPLTWNNWSPTTGQNPNSGFCLVLYSDGSWADASCATARSFICEQPFDGNRSYRVLYTRISLLDHLNILIALLRYTYTVRKFGYSFL